MLGHSGRSSTRAICGNRGKGQGFQPPAPFALLLQQLVEYAELAGVDEEDLTHRHVSV